MIAKGGNDLWKKNCEMEGAGGHRGDIRKVRWFYDLRGEICDTAKNDDKK